MCVCVCMCVHGQRLKEERIGFDNQLAGDKYRVKLSIHVRRVATNVFFWYECKAFHLTTLLTFT